MNVVDVSGLATAFVSRDRTVSAVRGVDLQLSAGRTLVILGESGSGKSVTLRSLQRLAGRTAEYSGSVEILGVDVVAASLGRLMEMRGASVALVPQDPAASLDPLRRVGTQIQEVLLTHRAVADRRAARARTLELLGQVGIGSPERVARSFPHELSGGMRQRVAIAIAISCGPAVLLADEPTTALDVTIQAQILRLFQQLQRELGMAILFVTHDVGVAREIADDVAVMYAGRIVERGPAHAVLNDPQHPYTRALLGAVPTPDRPRGTLPAIPGTPPTLDRPVVGCAFAPRCAVVQASCRGAEPPLLAVGPDAADPSAAEPGHEAACPVVVSSPRTVEAIA